MSPSSVEENAAVIAILERLARIGRRMMALHSTRLPYRERAQMNGIRAHSDDTVLTIEISGEIYKPEADE